MASERKNKASNETQFRSGFYPNLCVELGTDAGFSDALAISETAAKNLAKETFSIQPVWKLNVLFHPGTANINITETLTLKSPVDQGQDTAISVLQVHIDRSQYVLLKADNAVDGVPSKNFFVELKLKDNIRLDVERKSVGNVWSKFGLRDVTSVLVERW